MFGWLSDRFTNAGKLTRAANSAQKAANKYGTVNTRNAAKKEALDLEVAASTTKEAVSMAQNNLNSIQAKCSAELKTARGQVDDARRSHNEVKDTTFQKIKRFATLGPKSWGLSRSRAENLRQSQLANAATRKREQLRALATKQKAAMDAEEAAMKKRKEIIESALGTASSAANAAKQGALTNAANFKPNVSTNNAKKLNALLANNNSNASNPGTPTGGGRGRSRRRTHWRR